VLRIQKKIVIPRKCCIFLITHSANLVLDLCTFTGKHSKKSRSARTVRAFLSPQPPLARNFKTAVRKGMASVSSRSYYLPTIKFVSVQLLSCLCVIFDFASLRSTVSTYLRRPNRICLDLRSNSERLHYGVKRLH